jgi:hypothetical protein
MERKNIEKFNDILYFIVCINVDMRIFEYMMHKKNKTESEYKIYNVYLIMSYKRKKRNKQIKKFLRLLLIQKHIYL